MRPETLAAIKAILLTDPSIPDPDRAAIIAACKSPIPSSQPKKPPSKLLKIRQVAEIIGVHPRTIGRIVKRGNPQLRLVLAGGSPN